MGDLLKFITEEMEQTVFDVQLPERVYDLMPKFCADGENQDLRETFEFINYLLRPAIDGTGKGTRKNSNDIFLVTQTFNYRCDNCRWNCSTTEQSTFINLLPLLQKG